jgi:hypothetical protein
MSPLTPMGAKLYMIDAGHSIGPKLSSIIRRGDWYWPHARLDALVEIQSSLLEIEIGEAD